MKNEKNKVTIFIDGNDQRCSASEAAEFVPGRLDGTGAFETMRLYKNTVLFWPGHWLRWRRGLRRLGLTMNFSERKIKTMIVAIIRKNHMTDGRLRLMRWRNKKQEHLAIVPGFNIPQAKDYRCGYRACFSAVRRPRHPYTHLKILQYHCFRLSLMEARDQGYDEGILLNNKKEVVESSRGNIFYYLKGELKTPAIKSGCINGITRQQVMALARDSGLKCDPVRADAEDFIRAEEVFITNAVMGLMPVVSIFEHPIGKGCPGPVLQSLRRAYREKIENYCLSLGDKII
ncbi:MAG: aminotransferase class IV [Candidatus Omnitrophica bacterium]|nr:aminotransferase class IV [Candidatus Omnitrophota bacterium]